jgi:hypothetical protein
MTSYDILRHLGANLSILGAKNALEGVIYPFKKMFFYPPIWASVLNLRFIFKNSGQIANLNSVKPSTF